MSSNPTEHIPLPELPRYFPLHQPPPARRREPMRLVDLTVATPGTEPKTSLAESKSPERWKTYEFKAYAVVACIVLPIMAWIPISLSSCAYAVIQISSHCITNATSAASNPNYELYQRKLSPGWIPYRKVVSGAVIA